MLIFKSCKCLKDQKVMWKRHFSFIAQLSVSTKSASKFFVSLCKWPSSQPVVSACEEATASLCAVQQRLLWLTVDLIDNTLFFIAGIENSFISHV